MANKTMHRQAKKVRELANQLRNLATEVRLDRGSFQPAASQLDLISTELHSLHARLEEILRREGTRKAPHVQTAVIPTRIREPRFPPEMAAPYGGKQYEATPLQPRTRSG